MTKKDLFYIEDSLQHEKFLQNKCDEVISSMQDESLKSCIEKIAQTHYKNYQNLFDSF